MDEGLPDGFVPPIDFDSSRLVLLPPGESAEPLVDKLCRGMLSDLNLHDVEQECARLEADAKAAMEKAAIARRMLSEATQATVRTQIDDEMMTTLPLKTDAELTPRYELPRCELPTFDGDPKQFVAFFRQFDEQIERYVHNPSQRLNYLHFYCRGKAREAIKGCLFYSPADGYIRARKILQDLYGRRHVIVGEMLSEVTKPVPIGYDAESLTVFANELTTCADILAQLGYAADANSYHTIERVLERLPRSFRDTWVETTDDIYESGREPEFRDLCEFVRVRSRLARNRYSRTPNLRSLPSKSTPIQPNYKQRSYSVQVDKARCCKCGNGHNISDCEEFLELTVQKRWQLLKQLGCCFVCLEKGHRAQSCPSQGTCNVSQCVRKHHRLLHSDPSALCLTTAKNPSICLGVIPVVIVGPNRRATAWALLDSGSDTSLITSDLAEKIGLVRTPAHITLSTVGRAEPVGCDRVAFDVCDLERRERLTIPKAYAVKTIMEGNVASPDTATMNSWPHLSDLKLPSHPQGEVELLIGLDAPEAHWIFEQRRGRRKEPHADRTLLGWVVRGPMHLSHCRVNSLRVTLDDIQENLNKLYNSEFHEDNAFKKALSEDDARAVEMVHSSIRLEDGHFCIGLPWRVERKNICFDRYVAHRRLIHLRKRLLKDNAFFQCYKAVIQRYIDNGFAIPVPKDNRSLKFSPKWYLPHHAVINPKKPGKIRVVFDCASINNGTCLNSLLLQGPDMISSLFGVLLRFRKGSVALTADIEDMFLQVRVPPEDQGALRFLWWLDGDVSKPIEEFQLTIHPFGAVSSPFCANFALKHCASVFGSQYDPLCIEAIERSFYVDDCLISVDSKDRARQLISDLCDLLKRAGFRLTKWISNDPDVLGSIPEGNRAACVSLSELQPSTTHHTLGMLWNVRSDAFLFKTRFCEQRTTRRSILSQVASLFDPLGLVGPLLLPAKQLLQSLCRRKYSWDDDITLTDLELWNRWRKTMENLENLRIPRWYGSLVVAAQRELHIFSDASENGYGAVAYLRTCNENGSKCVLLACKSRVAPIKYTTVPRLELVAATLSCALFSLVNAELDLSFDRVYFWTDSIIVLYYIRNESKRYATFVANRVRQIKTVSKSDQWHHVSGSDNPADLASRGMSLDNNELDLWLGGPAFLREPVISESGTPNLSESEIDSLELKSVTCLNSAPQWTLDSLFTRYSSLMRLVRGLAWLLRFRKYLYIMKFGNSGSSLSVGSLGIAEIREAKMTMIKLIQRDAFPQELKSLALAVPVVPKTSCLRKLSPILVDGVLRVGGRLNNGHLPFEMKHPIIVPGSHPVAKLLILYYHELEGHNGATQVLSTMRHQFWMIRGRTVARRVLDGCVVCRRRNTRLCRQVMAPLPAVRLERQVRPFVNAGIDYFGPILVRRGRANEKRYGCIFTCLSVRAVHIEVVHSLTTDSFIQALMRFIARRGNPNVLISDNGSNFRSADLELKRCVRCLPSSRLKNILLEREIEWKFNPPEASHWGGVWERLIRMIRKIMQSVAGSQRLTDESLLTLMAEIERIVNNRPLVPLSEEPDSIDVLTPNHFLLLGHNHTMCDGVTFPQPCVRMWRQLQLLSNWFWRRWKSEYITLLQLRQKWLTPSRNLAIGDLVLISSDNTDRNHWPLGLITGVTPGSDGVVRDVMVKTASGTIRRDIRRLVLLECSN